MTNFATASRQPPRCLPEHPDVAKVVKTFGSVFPGAAEALDELRYGFQTASRCLPEHPDVAKVVKTFGSVLPGAAEALDELRYGFPTASSLSARIL